MAAKTPHWGRHPTEKNSSCVVTMFSTSDEALASWSASVSKIRKRTAGSSERLQHRNGFDLRFGWQGRNA
jgi:hypothetical protein